MSASPSPSKQLVWLGTLALAGMLVLGVHAAVEAGPGGGRAAWPATAAGARVAPDPDSLAADAPDPDSLAADAREPDRSEVAGLGPADSLAADTTWRARAYLPGLPGGGTGVSVAPRRLPGLRGRLGTYWQRSVTLDTTAYRYVVRERIGQADVRTPAELTLDEFLAAQRRAGVSEGFRALAAQRSASRTGRRRGGVGVTVDIPGGQQGAFRTLFGKNEVDLTVSGTSNVNLGLNYAESQAPGFSERGGVFNPDFGQNLNLNVAGTIGDKLRINVNYDTQSQFDFENQVSLVYTGYEDDIVQRIEAGNVFLQTPSELIRGGQRLFGLRTDLRLGPLGVTAVASQQDAETREVVIEGGSQGTTFSLAPTAYESDAHFFLGYAFHNFFDASNRTPGQTTLAPGFGRIEAIELWKHEPALLSTPDATQERVNAVAFADLAEPRETLAGGQEYFEAVGESAPLPSADRDLYSPANLERVRSEPNLNLTQTFGLGQGAVVRNVFRRLPPSDYTLDRDRGTVSLTTALADTDVLAVAYQYRTTAGEVVTVGDFGEATVDPDRRTVLKLLRADRPAPNDPLWDLTMRNVYRVGGRALTATAFTFDVRYRASGAAPAAVFPDLTVGEGQTLLQVFGLDRLNAQGQAVPDNAFDFVPGLTVDPTGGRVVFPVRRPFGNFLARLITTGQTVSGTTVSVSAAGGTPETAVARYAFPEMYRLRPTNAQQQFPALNAYQLTGEFRSSAQSVFNVGFNLVPNSVRVTAGGAPLREGTDFRVNTAAGTVEILREALLQSGQQIRVQVEQNKLFSIGSKSLLGLRADLRLGPEAGLGATWMRLAERPLGDKFRIGEEPIANTIAGLDGRLLLEPRWLTRALDRLPLINTRAGSRIELRGELARLQPGSPQTIAFEQTARRVREAGLELPEDERSGLSFIDDFESSSTTLSLVEPGAWRLAAPPGGAGPETVIPVPVGLTRPADILDVRYAHNWRGLFAWYTVAVTTYSDLRTLTGGPAARPVSACQLYPDRFTRCGSNANDNLPLPLLDLYFDPARRGPYNYNGDLVGAFAARPQDVWGGMVRPVDAAYTDFAGQNNVEFVELLVAPLGGRDGTEAIAPGAQLFVDLGRVNEDVLPDGFFNSEDGLRDGPPTDNELTAFGRRPRATPLGIVAVSRETGRTNDLGLDGLPSSVNDVAPGGQPYTLDERTYFVDFLATPMAGAEAARAALDPSADDFRHFRDDAFFGNPALFPGGASLQERFGHFFVGYELNSADAQREIARSGHPGVSTVPNSEDINGNQSLDVVDAVHRYAVPLDAAGLAASPFVEGAFEAAGLQWYLVRIPVRSDARTTTGGLARDDFSRIEAIRIWTSGHDRPATLRIASVELVGSQWLRATRVGTPDDVGSGTPTGIDPDLFVATISRSNNPAQYERPRTVIRRETASAFAGAGGGSSALEDERALVLRALRLGPERTVAASRSYATRPLDLTRYRNLRMFVHGHGFDARDDVRLVLRLGDDEAENYYEYEAPIFPFDPRAGRSLPERARADSLWQTGVAAGPGERVDRNSVNLVLAELNRLKVARDNARVPPSEVYRSDAPPEGAPAGARIAIRGQPSIQSVRTVVLGVRRGDAFAPLDTVEVWLNELRVTGYDEAPSTSGFLTANVAFADVGSLTARFSQTGDGFGELAGGLGGRSFAERTAFTLQSQFNAHKLLPERYGLNVPVSFSLTENASTPRFDPRRGDIRLDDVVTQALADTTRPGLSDGERRLRADALVERAQAVQSARSVRVQVSKTSSPRTSPWVRYTVGALNAAYTANAQTARDPTNQFADSDAWAATVAYRISVPRPRPVRPFWFAPVLGGLRVNALPQTVAFSTNLSRNLAAVQPRLAPAFEGEPDSVSVFRTRVRTTQRFDHGRQLDMQYTPLPFLTLSYGSQTAQDLGEAGQDERSRIYVRRPATDSTAAFAQVFDLSPDEARQPGSPVWQAFGITSAAQFSRLEVLGGPSLDVRPAGWTLADILSGERRLRTGTYAQTLTAGLRVSTRRVRYLSWITPQALSYQTNYQWASLPLAAFPDLDVAGAGSRVTLQTGLQLAPREFWRLFPFYRALEAQAGRTPGARPGTPAGRPAPAAAPDSSARRGFDPAALGRSLALAVTGLTDVSVTYRGAFSSRTGGLLGDSYSLPAALFGQAPPLGYRLGLDRRLGLGRRLNDAQTNLQFEDLLSDQHTVEARTTVEPFPQLRVGLQWQTSIQATDRFPFRFTGGADDDPTARALEALPADRRGTGQSTVLALGGSYQGLLERHLRRFSDDIAGGAGGDGRVETEFLYRTGLASDFRREFARGLGRFGPGGLVDLPLPGWDVSYSGLSTWPLLQRVAQQVTLRHNYSATSQAEYQSFLLATPPSRTVGLTTGAATIVAPAFEPGTAEPTTATVNERFQPLVGVQMTLRGGIQTDVTWNRSNLFALQSTTGQLTERETQDVTLQFSYARTGLRLLGVRRLNNNLRLTLTGSLADDLTFVRSLNEDALRRLRGLEPDEVTPQQVRLVIVRPQVSYTVSNQVTADLSFRYQRSDPRGRVGAHATTNFDGGVGLRILFSN